MPLQRYLFLALTLVAIALPSTEPAAALPVTIGQGEVVVTLPQGFASTTPRSDRGVAYKKGDATIELAALKAPPLTSLSDQDFLARADGLAARLQQDMPGSELVRAGGKEVAGQVWHEVVLDLRGQGEVSRMHLLTGRVSNGNLVLLEFRDKPGVNQEPLITAVASSVRGSETRP